MLRPLRMKGTEGTGPVLGLVRHLLAWDEEARGEPGEKPGEKKEAKVSSPCWPRGLYIVTHNDLREPAYNLYVCHGGPVCMF